MLQRAEIRKSGIAWFEAIRQRADKLRESGKIPCSFRCITSCVTTGNSFNIAWLQFAKVKSEDVELDGPWVSF